jgi:hypothetical protein
MVEGTLFRHGCTGAMIGMNSSASTAHPHHDTRHDTTPHCPTPPVAQGHLADIAISVNSTETIRKLSLEEPNLVLLNGDFAYANIFDFKGVWGAGRW